MSRLTEMFLTKVEHFAKTGARACKNRVAMLNKANCGTAIDMAVPHTRRCHAFVRNSALCLLSDAKNAHEGSIGLGM